MRYREHLRSEARRKSAVVLIKAILALSEADVLPLHKRELLSILLWKITEAESRSKYETRLQSANAFTCSEKKLLRHEHVFQRANMIGELLAASPSDIESILKKAIGCTVTTHEADSLRAHDDCYGWERYRRAGITVLDTYYEPPIKLPV